MPTAHTLPDESPDEIVLVPEHLLRAAEESEQLERDLVETPHELRVFPDGSRERYLALYAEHFDRRADISVAATPRGQSDTLWSDNRVRLHVDRVHRAVLSVVGGEVPSIADLGRAVVPSRDAHAERVQVQFVGDSLVEVTEPVVAGMAHL